MNNYTFRAHDDDGNSYIQHISRRSIGDINVGVLGQ